VPTPRDLFLSPDLTEAEARAYLGSLGFRDSAAVDGHLQEMADDPVVRETLGRLAPDLIQALLEAPDPDAAAMGMAQYVAARTGRAMFLDYLREDPRALHVLTYVLGASPALSEILIRTPEYFHWLVAQVERSAPDRQDHEEELVSALRSIDHPAEALNILRRWKRRETLRIGTRELLRRETVQAVASQLSDIAAVAIDFALAIVMRQRLDADGRDEPPGRFTVIGAGRLGAGEMSYDSGVDLFYVYDATPDTPGAPDFFVKGGLDLSAVLAEETHEGSLYRVAMPPWPQHEGRLTPCSLVEYQDHYVASAQPAERAALARARVVAGDADLGRRVMVCIEQFVYGEPRDRQSRPAEPPALLPSEQSARTGTAEIEHLTETFQVQHGPAHPVLRYSSTLTALEVMGRTGLIDESVRRELDHAYVFLRTAEHRRELGVPESTDAQLAASRERVREICRSLNAGTAGPQR
jgi:glutamate-ammonia-ligase adenylyltransferase